MAIGAKVIELPKNDGLRKKVKFAGEAGDNNAQPFTKPPYLNEQAGINNGAANKGMRKSASLPQFDGGNGKNEIPTRTPSNSGFRPSFLPSDVPDSVHSQERYKTNQPASYPSGYSDKNQLGASAARITELMKNEQADNYNKYASAQADFKVQGGRPSSSTSSKKRVTFQDNREENKSLLIEGESEETKHRREEKSCSLKNFLQMQIEEKERRLREEREKQRMQDELDEERIKKELEEENRRLQIEKEMEQKKIEEAKRQNQQIINEQNHRKMQEPVAPRRQSPPLDPPKPDYSNYERASKDYSSNKIAPGQAPPEYQPPGPVNSGMQYENDVFTRAEPAQKHHRLPNWPMRNHDVIHKESLIKELQLMLKQNLQVEAEKLKEEFQYNQKEFTDQIDKLKKETEKAILQRNAARKELGRMKKELDYKRDYDENYSRNLMVALTRYNPANMYRPPQEDPNLVPLAAPFHGAGLQRTRRDTPTKRQSYEQLFFQNDSAKAREIKTHRGESRGKSTAELFGVPSKYLPFKQDEKFKMDSQLIPLKDEQRSKKIEIPSKNLKRTHSFDANSFKKPKEVPKDDRLDGEVPPNFVFHLNDSKPGDLLPDVIKMEQGKSTVLPNGGLGVAQDHVVKEDRMGITNSGMPSLPEYDGLMNQSNTISKLMKNYIGMYNGDNEFKDINRKNDLMLQKLVDDKPEERYRSKPHVYVNPKEDVKLDDTFLELDDTFNDRSTVKLPSSTKHQNYDIVNKWESTLGELKKGDGHDDGIRRADYPLKPLPFDSLH